MAPGDNIVVRAAPPRFVGRGGEKLDAALARFGIDVAGPAGPRRRGVDRRLHRLPPAAGRGAGWWPSTSAGASSTSACAPTTGSTCASGPTCAPSTPVDRRRAGRHRRRRPVVHLPAHRCRRAGRARRARRRLVVLVKPQFEAGRDEVVPGPGRHPRPAVCAAGARRGGCRPRGGGRCDHGRHGVADHGAPRATSSSSCTPGRARRRAGRPVDLDAAVAEASADAMNVVARRPPRAPRGPRPRPRAWSRGSPSAATTCGSRSTTPSWSGVPERAVDDDRLGDGRRPGRGDRRRRHDAAHRRPRGRRTACRCSASTSASSATSPRWSPPTPSAPSSASWPASYTVEERMLLLVDVDAARATTGRRSRPAYALNEAVIEKTPMGHTVQLEVRIDGDAVPHLHRRRPDRRHADRLDRILPVGRRADRGPEPPELRAHARLAPHAVRPLAGARAPDPGCASRWSATAPPRCRSTDARWARLQPGDAVTCTAAPRTGPARDVRPPRLPLDPAPQVRPPPGLERCSPSWP